MPPGMPPGLMVLKIAHVERSLRIIGQPYQQTALGGVRPFFTAEKHSLERQVLGASVQHQRTKRVRTYRWPGQSDNSDQTLVRRGFKVEPYRIVTW